MTRAEINILQALKRFTNSLQDGRRTGVLIFDSESEAVNQLVVELLNQLKSILLFSYPEYLSKANQTSQTLPTLLLLEKGRSLPEQIVADFNGIVRTSSFERCFV